MAQHKVDDLWNELINRKLALDFVDAEALANASDISEGSLVRWNSSGERDAYGKVESTISEGQYDDEIDGGVTVNAPAALITVHAPGTGGWDATDQQVAHKPDTLTVIDELPDVESMGNYKMEGMADVPEEYVFDNPGSAMSKASDMGFDEIHTHGDGDNTVFMPGADHQALLDEIKGGDDGPQESMAPSNPVNDVSKQTMEDITEEELEALEKRREFDNPKIVEQDAYESLQGRVAEVRTVMEDALSEKTELKETTIEALEFEALCSEFEDDEGNLQVDALSQNPESGQPEPEQEEVESLSDETRQKAEALMSDVDAGFESAVEPLCEALEVDTVDEAREVLN